MSKTTAADIFEEVVAKAGGRKALAAALGQTIFVINNWRQRGIPVYRCKEIEQITGIPVRLLRPDDWRLHWSAAAEEKKAKARRITVRRAAVQHKKRR